MDTTLVGVVMNGLSHLCNIQSREHFACALIKGLGGNLVEGTREKFAKEVFGWTGTNPPDGRRLLDTYYNLKTGSMAIYSSNVSLNLFYLNEMDWVG